MMLEFKNSGYDRKNFDLKEIRNDLMHIIGKAIAWEIAIGKLISEETNYCIETNSIFQYLGKKLTSILLIKEPF